MLKKVSAELDQLMWMIAEGGDTQAVEEFEKRHPELRYELAKRISMLRGLKSAGKAAHAPARAPTFRPIEPRRQPPTRWVSIGVGALGLAALAAASYTVVSFFDQPAKPVVRSQVAPPSVVRQEPSPEPRFEPRPQQQESEPPRQETSSREEETPAYLRPQDVKIDHAPLSAALRMIAAQGGLTIEIGPGLPSHDVKIDFRGRNTIEMLKELGRRYAFTAFDQGDGSVLVIPAVDPSQKGEPASNIDPLSTKHTQNKDMDDVRRSAPTAEQR